MFIVAITLFTRPTTGNSPDVTQHGVDGITACVLFSKSTSFYIARGNSCVANIIAFLLFSRSTNRYIARGNSCVTNIIGFLLFSRSTSRYIARGNSCLLLTPLPFCCSPDQPACTSPDETAVCCCVLLKPLYFSCSSDQITPPEETAMHC